MKWLFKNEQQAWIHSTAGGYSDTHCARWGVSDNVWEIIMHTGSDTCCHILCFVGFLQTAFGSCCTQDIRVHISFKLVIFIFMLLIYFILNRRMCLITTHTNKRLRHSSMYDLVWLYFAEANNEQDQEQRLSFFLPLFLSKRKEKSFAHPGRIQSSKFLFCKRMV